MTTDPDLSRNDSDHNALNPDEISELAAKTRLAADQANTSLNDAFRTIAAHEHPRKEFTFAYAPVRHGHTVHAYLNPDSPGIKANLDRYTTETTTFNDLASWRNGSPKGYRTARNQYNVTTQLRTDAERDPRPSFPHVNRYNT